MKDFVDCIDIADAHAQYIDVKKMISGSQMKVFVVSQGLYGYFKNHTGDLESATYDELKGGEFNFINDHPSNISSLMDAIIYRSNDATEVTLPDGSKKTQQVALTALKAICESYANQKQYPYKDKTQQDLDAAKAERSLRQNPTVVIATDEGNIDTVDNLPYVINKYKEHHKIALTLNEAIPFDDVFTITATSTSGNGGYTAENITRGVIRVPANQTMMQVGAEFYDFEGLINNTGAGTKIRYYVTSQYQRDFSARMSHKGG